MIENTYQSKMISLPKLAAAEVQAVPRVSAYRPVWPEVSEPDSRFEHELDAHLARAFTYCMDTQDPRGAWQSLPDPRPFDSGLVAYALSGIPKPEAEAAVRRACLWLRHPSRQKHSAFARLFDEVPGLILNRVLPALDLRDPALYSEVYNRKTLLLYALGKHAGIEVLTPFHDETIREWFREFYKERSQLHLKQWGRVDLLSMYVLLEQPEADERAVQEASQYLQTLQAADGSFCHNPLSSALALLALTKSAPDSLAWQRCLRHLLEAQQSDGTWRFCTSDIWDTSLTVRTWADYPPFRKYALERGLGFLLGSQNHDGGWGFRTDVESDNDTSACVLLALSQPPHSDSRCVKDGLAYLAARQRQDGLWNTWQSQEDHPVEDCVAHAAAALRALRGKHEVLLGEAQRWLVKQYRSQGRWTQSWYRNFPYVVLEVGRGLGAHHPITWEAVKSVVAAQNDDGGWGPEPSEDSCPSATGLALAAILDHRYVSDPVVMRGLRFLMQTQREDGTWPGQPELFGPRPLLYHLQTNTHAFASQGLLAAWQRLRS